MEKRRSKGARTDAVLVHERDEVGFGQQRRLRRDALLERQFVGLEALADLKLGEVIASPLVVDVDVEVVALADDEACTVHLSIKTRGFMRK